MSPKREKSSTAAKATSNFPQKTTLQIRLLTTLRPMAIQRFPVVPFAAVVADVATVKHPTVAAARPAIPGSTVPNDVATEPGARIANIGATARTTRCAMAKRVTAGALTVGLETTVKRPARVDITERCARTNANAIPATVTGKAGNVYQMKVL